MDVKKPTYLQIIYLLLCNKKMPRYKQRNYFYIQPADKMNFVNYWIENSEILVVKNHYMAMIYYAQSFPFC